jgi:hypothetical protein
MDMHKEFLRLKAENERLKQQALADDLAMEAAAERDNERLREERLAFAEESERRLEEIKQLRDALTEIWQLDSPGQCAEIASKALEGNRWMF